MSSSRPYRCSVDAAERFAYLQMWGVVTGDDLLTAAREVHADPEWTGETDLVWDCSAVRSHDIVPSQVGPVVAEEAASGEGCDVLVTSATASDRAITEMFAAYCRHRGKDVTVVRSLAEALAHLGREALPDSIHARPPGDD